MTELNVDNTSAETIKNSFDQIANNLFNNFQLQVNDSFYRLIDIEFYYFSDKLFHDMYVHKFDTQKQSGRWYFHGSGIDITCGNGENYGGILIRAIMKLTGNSTAEKHYFDKQIHGPLSVARELCSNLHNVFENSSNIFKLVNISADRDQSKITITPHIIKTKRIGLKPENDNSIEKEFHNGKFRYVIFPHLKHRDKTQIAKDMLGQFSKEDINKLLGSIFIK